MMSFLWIAGTTQCFLWEGTSSNKNNIGDFIFSLYFWGKEGLGHLIFVLDYF